MVKEKHILITIYRKNVYTFTNKDYFIICKIDIEDHFFWNNHDGYSEKVLKNTYIHVKDNEIGFYIK